MIRYSVIIIALSLRDDLISKALTLLDYHSGIEVIISYVFSSEIYSSEKNGKLLLVKGSRGRGLQLNAGAKKARGDILIFLHSDTSFSREAFLKMEKLFKNKKIKLSCFRIAFDYCHWVLKIYGFFSRYDSFFTSFGDQGIVVRKDFFNSLGGFSDWPLFEDVDFLRRARKKASLVKVKHSLTTSASRYLQNGIVFQQVKNFISLIKYYFKNSPWDLANEYENRRKK